MRHQAITWTNVYPALCRHMASVSHNDLKSAISGAANMNWFIIGSYNGLLHIWHQAITETKIDFLSLQLQAQNFSENLIKTE